MGIEDVEGTVGVDKIEGTEDDKTVGDGRGWPRVLG